MRPIKGNILNLLLVNLVSVGNEKSLSLFGFKENWFPRAGAFFWFPRAGVGMNEGRASVQSFWITRRWRVANAFPRWRMGTRKTG